MSDELTPIVPIPRKLTLGDRMRNIASQLRQEDDVQIKATSRILGAAAQLAENHDRLIDEVVEMVEEDLDRTLQPSSPEPYTVELLQQQFESLKQAKAHFSLKARSWAALVEKLNKQSSIPSTNKTSVVVDTPPVSRSPQNQRMQDPVSQHLEIIGQDLQMMRADMNRMIQLLEILVDKLS